MALDGAEVSAQHYFDIIAMRRLSEDRGVSQRALAEALQVDKGTVIRWSHGYSEPSPRLLPGIAEVLGVSPAELYRPGAQGADLAYYRVLAGYSRNALSAEMKLGNSALRAVEIGERDPSPAMLEVFRKLFGLDESVLRAALTRRPGPAPQRSLTDRAPARLEPIPDRVISDEIDPPARVFFAASG